MHRDAEVLEGLILPPVSWTVGPKVHLVTGFLLKTGSWSKISQTQKCWKTTIMDIFWNFVAF